MNALRDFFRLWAKLATISATAGLVSAVLLTIGIIDEWILYKTWPEIAVVFSHRLVVALGTAAIFALVGTSVFAAGSMWRPGSAELFERVTIGFFAVTAALLGSLVFWRALFIWIEKVFRLGVPTGTKYFLWLTVAAAIIAYVRLRERHVAAIDELSGMLGGSATRRVVITSGIAASLTAAASADLRVRVATGVIPSTTSARPNILLITFDALTAEDMSLYGYHLPTTPRLDAFARSSTVFTNFYSGSSWTVPSIASVFTGKYPSESRVFHSGARLSGVNARENFVQLLAAAGYVTAATVANPFILPARFGPEFAVVPRPPIRSIVALPPLLTDDVVWTQQRLADVYEQGILRLGGVTVTRNPPDWSFAQARELIERLPSPFFLWIHVMAPHAPYDPSPPFFGRFLDTNEFRFYGDLEALRYYGSLTYPAINQPAIDKWRLRYDEWIAQADEAFGTFVSELDRSGKLANTAVLISADHGESFDGGLWGHNTPVLLRPIIHIPLLVRVPGQANGRVDAPFDHTDLAPTILHLAGLPQPAWMKGQPLSAPLETLAGRQRLAFTQHVEVSNSAFRAIRSGTVGVMDERFQYVLNIATGKGSLFHLAEAHRQTNDIGNDNPQVAAAMRDAILSRFRDLAGNDA